jgi:hypothetical protein
MKINKPLVVILFSITLSISIIDAQIKNIFSKYDSLANQIVKTALIEKKGYSYLEELCKFGHRLSGSENSLKAIYWAKEKMEKLGFDSVWLQPVMVPHWIRGNIEKAKIVKSKFYKNRNLSVTALGRSKEL